MRHQHLNNSIFIFILIIIIYYKSKFKLFKFINLISDLEMCYAPSEFKLFFLKIYYFFIKFTINLNSNYLNILII